MSVPTCIFIKCETQWSYAYIGSVKDFISLDLATLERYYQAACRYLTLRHNFLTGHLDAVAYKDQLNQLATATTSDTTLWAIAEWHMETLYRRIRPITNTYRCAIEQVVYTNDDKGDILGLIVYLRNNPINSQMYLI